MYGSLFQVQRLRITLWSGGSNVPAVRHVNSRASRAASEVSGNGAPAMQLNDSAMRRLP